MVWYVFVCVTTIRPIDGYLKPKDIPHKTGDGESGWAGEEEEASRSR